MRIQYILLIIFGILFALMLGSFLFCISLGFLPKASLVQEIEKLYSHRFLSFLMGLFLYAVSYIVTKTLIKRLTREEVYVAEGEYGRVAISMTVVEDTVKKVLRRFEYVKKYKLKFFSQSKKLVINVRIKEWEGEEVADRINEINKELKARLDKIVGLRENFEVLIKIEKVEDVSPETQSD